MLHRKSFTYFSRCIKKNDKTRRFRIVVFMDFRHSQNPDNLVRYRIYLAIKRKTWRANPIGKI